MLRDINFAEGRKQILSISSMFLLSVSPSLEVLAAEAIEEIVVSATRRAQSVQDIPYNISAMSGDQLQAANVTDLTDLSRTIPGLAYADVGVRSAGINNQMILRGLNANAQGSIGAFVPTLTPAAVSTYMDNTPVFINLRTTDLNRVEVLRGPQGTLYGAGSVGGTLRFIFNEPDATKFAANFNGGLSSTQDADDLNYSVDGMINIPIANTAALRIAGGYEDRAGFIDARRLAVGGHENPQIANPADPFGSPLLTEKKNDVNDADLWHVRGSLLWDITERFQAKLTYLRQEENADAFAAQTDHSVPGAEERVNDLVFKGPLEREIDLVSLELGIDLGFASLESSSSYTRNKSDSQGDLSGLARINDIAAGGFVFGGFPETNGRLAGFFDGTSEEKTFTQEIRLISNGGGNLDWLAGFFYQDIDFVFLEDITVPGFADYATTPGHPFTTFLPVPPSFSFADIIAGPPGFVTSTAVNSEVFFTVDRAQDIEDMALFGELTYHITNAWQVTGGIRIFRNENKSSLTNTFPLFGAVAAEDGVDPTGLNTAEGKDDVQDEIFKVNTSYDLNHNLMVYFTWAEGFRRGGANAFPLSGFNAEDPSLLSYQPDTATNWEIGAKGVLLNRLSYTAAIYRIDWDNPQIAGTFIPSGFSAVVNGEEAQTQGVELEGRLRVTNTLEITVGYTYTDAEFTKDFATPLAPSDSRPDFQATDGNKLPGVPENIATLAIDYNRPLSLFGGSNLHVRLDGFYRSSVVTSSSPLNAQFERLDGFDIWNASVSWSNGSWRMTAYVKNIGDELGITSVVRDFKVASPLQSLDLVTRPRTFGVTFGYTY